jgi:metal-responsive CopG/Arc/MetJ family transcriptional regulator
MGKTLTIELPDELYDSLKELSKGGTEREISEQLVQIIASFVEEEHRQMNDPIFKPITAQGSGVSDVSERHDEYLYRNSD